MAILNYLFEDVEQLLARQINRASAIVWKIAFSPDGNKLASVGWDGAVKLWDVASGELLWSGRHTHHVNNLAFLPEGSIPATSGLDATVRI